MKILFIIISIGYFIVLTSCSNQNNSQNVDIAEDSTDIAMEEQIFQIPSPDEFIALLKTAKAPYKANITAPENLNFIDANKQKLNLGVYSADMAYLATYNKFQETVRYFSKVKSLSDQIGISHAIEKSTFERLEKNLTNVDSITFITNNSFYNVVDKIQQNDDGKTLALISYGGWIESMYIAFQLAGDFNADNPIIQRIASQKIALTNLIGMFGSLKDKNPIEENIINELNSIKTEMDKITSTIEEIPATKDTTKVIIGGKTFYKINKETFLSIKQLIEKIRNEMIKQA